MRSLLRSLIFVLLAPLVSWAQVPNQLVTISPDGKYLYNSITNQPVFLTGDSPQELNMMLTNANANVYFADRATLGINSLWLYATSQTDQNSPPKDVNGNVPFDGAWFVSPDAAYWTHLDSIIQMAGTYNEVVFLQVGFVGGGGDQAALLASSDATVTAYGTFLGNRYKSYNNIVYVLGGDADLGVAGLTQKINDLGNGIAAADPNHLITFEACRATCGSGSNKSSLDAFGGNPPSWLKLNWIYSTQLGSPASCQAGFAASAASLPPLMGEDYYEAASHGMTGAQVRQEGYWEVLSGCYLGRMFGNGPIWSFNSINGWPSPPNPTWQSQLGSTGSAGQQFLGQLMNSREHWLMVPDVSHTYLTANFGSGSTLSVLARTSDGQTMIAYFIDGNATAKSINMAGITSASSTVQAWWYNPQNAVATSIGTFANSGSHAFTAPDGNDWVLVLDDASANLPPPGGGPTNNPIPTITSLNPSTVAAGGQAFNLTVNGTGFVPSSVVNFKGTARTTTFVSATQLTAAILAGDIASSGNVNVTVTNPAPGGGTTSNFVFVISGSANPSPTLTSVSPTAGTLGQSISLTLTGTNFIPSSVVNFGSNADTGGVVSNGGNTLTITIPAGQLAAAGPLNVTASNPAPGGGTSNVQVFTINNPAPVLNSIAPTSATAGGASFTLTLTGTGFVSGAKVNFGANPSITPTSITNTQIVATVPAPDIAVAGTFNVSVTNPVPGGGTSGAQSFTINNPPPTIASLNPSTVAAGGALFTLTVNGTGFVQNSGVNFNAKQRTTTFISATQLTATILATDIATAGNANVTVTNPAPGGGTTTNFAFVISAAPNPVPALTSIAPTSGTLGQSVLLTLTGTNFISSSIVNFGSNGDTGGVVSNGGNTLTITIPAAQLVATGPLNVTVTNPTPGGGTSAASAFTVNNPAPSITSLSPASAVANTGGFTLTVDGSGFVNSSAVNFNGVAKATTFVSSTKITAAILATEITAIGNFPVTVTNPTPGGGTSTPVNFAVTNPPPTITLIGPTTATAGGAAFTLTVNGAGFVNGATVNFGANPPIVPSFTTGTQITATVPAADIATPGTINVTVTNPAPGGGTSAAQTFTINNPTPTLASIAPASATAGSASFTLTLTGTGFVSGAKVNFGANPSITPTSITSTQIVATVPAADIATAGAINVSVTNPAPGGGTSTAQSFTVNNPVVGITSLSPTSAIAGGTAFTLTVNGTGFVSGSMVNFNGAAKTTTFKTPNQLTATITAADILAAGIVNVTVTNPAPGGGSSSAASFTINNPAPVLSSLSPTSAAVDGAAFSLTVNGTGFVNGATVQFNGSNRATTFVSGTRLTASILAADLSTAGTSTVTVTNPTPTIGPSASQSFAVNNPVPAVTALGQNHAAGGAAFTLRITGTNFVSNSVVNFNGKTEVTTFSSPTSISAAIPASDVATAGNVNVTVTNPAPGGGTTAASTFMVDGFSLDGPSTATITSGGVSVIQVNLIPTANGFANPISFSVSGIPAHLTALFNPPTVTLTGNSTGTILTVTNPAAADAPPTSPVDGPWSPLLRPLLGIWIAALLGWLCAGPEVRWTPQLRRFATIMPLSLLLVMLGMLAGCALGVTSGGGGTPSNNASMTITATSGTLTQTTQVTLTITQ